MLAYVRTLSIEMAKRGVTANYVAPGFVDTAMLAGYADYRERVESKFPAALRDAGRGRGWCASCCPGAAY